MAEFPEYESHDALGLAALVRRREVTAAELLEAAFARVDAANAAINAVVLEQRDRAMTRARSAALGGPFAGVPMLLKDLGCEAIDFPSNCGSRFFAGLVHHYDSEVYLRIACAGFVRIASLSRRGGSSSDGILPRSCRDRGIPNAGRTTYSLADPRRRDPCTLGSNRLRPQAR